MLFRSEARVHLGELVGESSALEDLNQVRYRADLPSSAAATQDELLLAIENERRFEFAFEAHRWFDLARTKRAKEVLEALNPNASVEPYELLFPIPVTQRQLDPFLDPNPGYN